MNGFRPAGASLPKPRQTIVARDTQSSYRDSDLLSGSIIVDRARDRFIDLFQRKMMPQEVRDTLEGAINGDLRFQLQLFSAMIDTWPRLQKALGEVKRAVRTAPWQTIPFAARKQKPSAASEKLAKEVENAIWSMRPDPITGLQGFEGTVEDLALAYYLGVGVRETHYTRKGGKIRPKGTMHVPPRFYGYPANDEGPDRLMLDPQGTSMGFGNFIDFPPNRFLIGVCRAHPSHPTVSAPLRVLTGYWLAAIFGLQWLMEFSQIFGQPTRWATYPTGDEQAKAVIMGMMENIGTAAYGVFPDNTDIKFVESAKSATGLPSRELLKLADEQCDIFILGQNLTTDSGDKGARSLGEVHMEVRKDVVKGVADFVGEILTHQLSPAIVELNGGNRDEAPGIWAVWEESVDEKALAERDNALGITSGKVPVAKAWFYERHKIPPPAEGDELFEPAQPPGGPQIGADGLPLPPAGDEEDGSEEEKQRPRKKVEAAAAARPTVDKLADAVLEGLTGTKARWLAPMRPVFERLITLAESGDVTDGDFREALERGLREMPEYFELLDTEALQEALENAIGSAMLAGSVQRYEQ